MCSIDKENVAVMSQHWKIRAILVAISVQRTDIFLFCTKITDRNFLKFVYMNDRPQQAFLHFLDLDPDLIVRNWTVLFRKPRDVMPLA